MGNRQPENPPAKEKIRRYYQPFCTPWLMPAMAGRSLYWKIQVYIYSICSISFKLIFFYRLFICILVLMILI